MSSSSSTTPLTFLTDIGHLGASRRYDRTPWMHIGPKKSKNCNQLGSDASTFFCLFMLSIVYCLSFIVLLQIKEIPEGFSLLLLLCRCCCWSKLANFSNKNFPAMCETFTTCVVNNGKYLKTGQFARWSNSQNYLPGLFDKSASEWLDWNATKCFFVSIFEQDRAGGGVRLMHKMWLVDLKCLKWCFDKVKHYFNI